MTFVMSLIEDQDAAVKHAALQGLSHFGKHAAEVAPKLQAMLNDPSADDKTRDLAKKALKAVDPRKGLMNVE